MELSKRMKAVANLVTAGYITADIGTDHGYIPMYLVEMDISPKVIAMDIGEGPLSCATQNVASSGLSHKISLRLSDGLRALCQGEAQSAVLSGMGGPLIIRILRESRSTVRSLRECILQPQSQVSAVRAFLLEEGFIIDQEDMVFEDGKFYPMMKVRLPEGREEPQETWSQVEIQFGKHLLCEQHCVLKQFLEKEEAQKSAIIKKLKKRDSVRSNRRILELSKELYSIRKGLEYYAM